MSLTIEYISTFEKFKEKYGEKTVVLMQVGSFYEMYATNEMGPNLEIIGPLINAVLTRKDKSLDVNEKNPKMMGFPLVSFGSKVKILIENNYTVVVIDQVTNPPNPKREITNIFTPSTYIEEVITENNYLLSIFISSEKGLTGKQQTGIGLTAIDLNIGKILVEEYYSSLQDENLPWTRCKEMILKLSPREIIINKVDEDLIRDNLDLDTFRILKEENKDISKLNYQEKFLTKVFGGNGFVNIFEYLELENKEFIRLSLINALNYCYIQNEKILKNISKPRQFDTEKLILGNNCLTGLNVISKGDKRDISLFDIIDCTNTVMGKRLLKERLLNPEINVEIISKRYNIIEKLLTNNYYQVLEECLKEIRDLERFSRRIVIGSLHPCELFSLYHSLRSSLTLINFLKEKEFNIFTIKDDKLDTLKTFFEFIETKFNIDKLQKFILKDISDNFYNKGIYKDLDDLDTNVSIGEDLIDDLIKSFNGLAKEDLKFSINNNKKEGQYLLLTKKRGDKLFDILQHWEEIEIKKDIKIIVKDLDISHTKTSTKIYVPRLGETHKDANELQIQISIKTKEHYLQDLEIIGNQFIPLFQDIIKFISEIDFYVSGAKVSQKYNYVKPEISQKENSFVEFENLRHPIIERIINYEYVPQSLQIGNEIKGILLYGLNSSGKSSFQKSIGLSIILAQIGYYVPASKFTFCPYNHIFTRIDANDNLFKGLSSFSLEMVDLKNILKYQGVNTLVIGDEVCKGTEYLSANSILAATIISLSQSGTNFIFATHLHLIPKIPEIKELKNVECYHLAVHHSTETNELIFDRKLQKGQGDEIYGILVASNIIKNPDFISLTNNIKLSILGIPDKFLQNKVSRYNSKVVIDHCEICGDRESKGQYEVHHINFQKDCENGFVKNKDHISKNSEANLVVLCENCHTKLHQGKIKITQKIKTSTGNKII
jgi:DNA mismatch repair protein MutS